MKVVILAGGLGTRLGEETSVRPKPMVEIGHQPILWHIMKLYSKHGLNDFVILCGYKSHIIKDYFINYAMRASDVTIDFTTGETTVIRGPTEPWKVTLLETGLETNHGGRLGRARDYIDNSTFCMHYGDTVSDVNITKELEFHKTHNSIATMTLVQPPGRFGAVYMAEGEDVIASFKEKPDGDGAWVNGGFFVLEPGIMDYIDGDQSDWGVVLKNVAHDGQLVGFRHPGFWHPMDTLPDKNNLEKLWSQGKAPWKVW
jgi:glucose-1-phosphate cytidylyltransferase